MAIRSLGSRGIEVIAGDEYAMTPGALSRYAVASFVYPPPASDPSGFLAAVEQAVHEHAPGPEAGYVLMPIHREGHVIAEHRARFEPHIRVPLANSGDIERVRHKAMLLEIAERAGLRTPATRQVPSEAELDRVAREVGFPAFIKLPGGVSGLGIARVADMSELSAAYRELVQKFDATGSDAPIVQAEVPGGDYCVALLFDHGKRVAGMVYRNVIQYPPERGPGVVRETVAAPLLEREAEKLLESIGWHGMAEIDFRWSGDDRDPAYLIEVNPRFFGGLFQAIASGVDFPWLLYELAVEGHARPPESVAIGVRTQAPVTGLLGILHELADQPRDFEAVERAWESAKQELEAHGAWRATLAILSGLGESIAVKERAEHVRRVLEQNAHNLTLLLDAKDPLPALGLLYPLGAFLRHGKLSARMLAGADH